MLQCLVCFRHDVQVPFRETNFATDMREMMEKGFVSERSFQVLVNFQKEESQLSDPEIWDFLIQLHLATPIADPPSLYIPSLIPDVNEKYIKDQLRQFRESDNSVGFHYSFKKCREVSGFYNRILSKLASKEFFYKMKNPGISFRKAYSEKIENRTLGVVGGLNGTLKWTTDRGSSPEILQFLVLEMDCDNFDKNFKFARHKVNKTLSNRGRVTRVCV